MHEVHTEEVNSDGDESAEAAAHDHYEHYEHTNCYGDNGADNLGGAAGSGQSTLVEAKAICSANPSCGGFVYQTPAYDSTVNIGRYWLRNNIHIPQCPSDSSFDMYVKSDPEGGDSSSASSSSMSEPDFASIDSKLDMVLDKLDEHAEKLDSVLEAPP
jgi:hypothetical protein